MRCCPARATQNELDIEDAKSLVKNDCISVGEGANMPSTLEAIDVSLAHKILIGPGKAANAGSVAVSGLDMAQNSMRQRWTRNDVDKRLHEIMKAIHSQCNGLTFRHEAMATHFEIIVAGCEPRYAQQAAAAAFRELDRLEGELSRFVESSDIARLNGLVRGQSTLVSHDTLECLLAAADAALATGRAFDPAYASVRDGDLAPDALPFHIDAATHTVTSNAARLQLDLGAVGKGYALDQMADTLREWGVSTACLNSGDSTVLALAPPPDAAGWPVGFGETGAHRTLALAHAVVSGSGTAIKGTHLVDPRTGVPATRESRTWALAPGAAVADALSTAFFVMTDAEIIAFCAAHPSIGAALVDRNGELALHGEWRLDLANPPGEDSMPVN